MSSSRDDDPPTGDSRIRTGRLLNQVSTQAKQRGADLARTVASNDLAKGLGNIDLTPGRFKRRYQETGVVGLITQFPIAVLAVFLVGTLFFVYHSGALDDTGLHAPEEPSLNVNGDLEAYLPSGSEVSEELAKVEEDWSTNVMIIYVESPNQNITTRTILLQMDEVERALNPVLSDGGEEDGIIYALSISTVIKELNGSRTSLIQAMVAESGSSACGGSTEDCPLADLASATSDQVQDFEDLIGAYSIPNQQIVDRYVREMYECRNNDAGRQECQPSSGLDKMSRDVEGNDGRLDRAVIVIALAEEYRGMSVKDRIESYQGTIDQIASQNRWNCDAAITDSSDPGFCQGDELGLTMTLTGPVPITNAVTEFSFKLFWAIFPLALVLVAATLWFLHSDFIQTGSVRPLQGFKVVVISGLPTLCAVFWTLGIIGFTNFEVTMTVIIVGPIVLALGVSYGLHIMNRYAEEEGTKEEKIAKAMNSTGKAVLLSAITTIIGFISLTFTPMAPIATVGWALSGGILVVYVLTIFMTPNLLILLDLKKAKHPPLKAFNAAVSVPISRPRAVLAFFLVVMLVSVVVARPQVGENIDLLGMAPQGEASVDKMNRYSTEFDAGQIGMIRIDGATKGSLQDDVPENDDPAEVLRGIEELQNNVNSVDNATAVSIVFLMKSVQISQNVSGTPIADLAEDPPSFLPEEAVALWNLVFDREVGAEVSFWDVLQDPATFGLPATQSMQIFLLDVFYATLEDETLQLFVNAEHDVSLIYVDMPYLPVATIAESVDAVNEYTQRDIQGITAHGLVGVASVTIEVNNLIVGSQWSSLGFAIVLTLLVLAVQFRDPRYALWTTSPVIATVALQWLVMASTGASLSLVTVMIGSILVGIGVDFSIHIANRIKELGGGIEAIRQATVSTGMSLFEAALVTTAGLAAAFQIPITEIKPFLVVILIMLWIAALSALILLPAIFTFLERVGLGTGHATSSSFQRRAGLSNTHGMDSKDDQIFTAVMMDDAQEAW